ncbi:unnamed protein product [Brassica rapa subsp. trilocularis]
MSDGSPCVFPSMYVINRGIRESSGFTPFSAYLSTFDQLDLL